MCFNFSILILIALFYFFPSILGCQEHNFWSIAALTSVLFFNLLIMNYYGAKGRIEKRNQSTGHYQDLGATSPKEDEAFLKGTHTILAFKQALIGALIWSLLAFGLMYFFI